ncbi:MAG: FecR domain-containing protein [Spirochaetia bacterium]|nr:FecR domain-containing protein [Spirochaetia bacterium]
MASQRLFDAHEFLVRLPGFIGDRVFRNFTFLFLGFACLHFAFADEAGARVIRVSGGSASLFRPDAGGNEAHEGLLTTGKVLSTGDKIVTGPGCQVVLQLRDGTRLEIAEESHLVIGDESIDGGKKRIFSLQFGELIAKVRKLASADESFVIVTPTAIAGVRGTVFSVAVGEDGTTQVGVSEGSVAVDSELSEKETPALVNTGEAVETTAMGFENKRKFDAAKFQFAAWRDGNRELVKKDFSLRAERLAERFKNSALQMIQAQEDLRATVLKLHEVSRARDNAKQRRERRLMEGAEKEEILLLRRCLDGHHRLLLFFERLASWQPLLSRMRAMASGRPDLLEKMRELGERNKEIREKLEHNRRGMAAFFDEEKAFILQRLELHGLAPARAK